MPIEIRISPAGIDAEKAKIKDLIYTSETDTFKIQKMGVAAKAKAGSFDIDHDLKYKPFFWIFSEGGASGQMRKQNYFADVSSTDFEEIDVATPNSTPDPVDLYYYIFINIIL